MAEAWKWLCKTTKHKPAREWDRVKKRRQQWNFSHEIKVSEEEGEEGKKRRQRKPKSHDTCWVENEKNFITSFNRIIISKRAQKEENCNNNSAKQKKNTQKKFCAHSRFFSVALLTMKWNFCSPEQKRELSTTVSACRRRFRRFSQKCFLNWRNKFRENI